MEQLALGLFLIGCGLALMNALLPDVVRVPKSPREQELGQMLDLLERRLAEMTDEERERFVMTMRENIRASGITVAEAAHALSTLSRKLVERDNVQGTTTALKDNGKGDDGETHHEAG